MRLGHGNAVDFARTGGVPDADSIFGVDGRQQALCHRVPSPGRAAPCPPAATCLRCRWRCALAARQIARQFRCGQRHQPHCARHPRLATHQHPCRHCQRPRLTLHCPFGDLYGASVQLGLSDASTTVASFNFGAASDKRYAFKRWASFTNACSGLRPLSFAAPGTP